MSKIKFNLSKITLLAATLMAVSFIFVGFPQIDITVSALFYKPEQNFLLRNTPLHLFVDSWIRPSIKYLTVTLVVACVYKLFLGKSPIKRRFNIVAFLFSSFLLGPVLLVNGLLKEFIGRARPKNIIEYGGTKIFSPAYFPADQCETNCSFVSGDAAVAFSTIAFALIFKGKLRFQLVAIALSFGVLVSIYRLGTGAHFLSDTVLSGLFCILIILILERMLLRKADQTSRARN
ncbi:MAG: phosphatase PAP2 family protein [Pseudomonadota bacterium]|nr:phosphatase PAP2 family protein [Pseudomonadota bacterium]MEC8234089.1 phosphatase PAP2 family protein [Pseudomonadota bacterium]MED5301223.1 phosphatase PAP2 family protein [Pseudomonadota bacterium]|tara:strand:- start:614 stop:1312 length:699 start_codon:yes stop_codon:yes gene_type:complete